MSDEKESKKPIKPRLCERCGSRVPPQKRGRPRRWCSQQCRQSAYEERHGLESWKDKQPKVNSLSDVVEEMSSRGGGRAVNREQAVEARDRAYTSTDCLIVVTQDLILMTMVVERVIDMVRGYGVVNTIQGRLLAKRVAELVNVVRKRSMAVVPVDAVLGSTHPTLKCEGCRNGVRRAESRGTWAVTSGVSKDWEVVEEPIYCLNSIRSYRIAVIVYDLIGK